MKALPMLDHVMLWVARGFVGILLAGAAFNLWQSIMAHSPNPDINSIDVSVMEVVIISLLGLSLLKAWNPFSRTFVIFVSVLTLLMAFFVLYSFDPGEMSDRDADSIRIFYGTLIAGFPFVLWSASRPRSVTPIQSDLPHQSAVPQSC